MGYLLFQHEDKANHLWCSFKNRIGVSNNVTMHFDLNSLVSTFPDADLDSLVAPFMRAKIDKIVKSLPTDKAPGPDGFNGVFMKKCWPIIREDIYKLFLEFYDNKINLSPINSSYIVLVPKISSPVTALDFRPISLLNCCIKLLTKLLADRLQLVILKLIHKNQYGFIRHRTIHDCLAWSFEYIYQCQQSKKEIVIVKLDFTKAFDTIEHNVILEMMLKLEFPSQWLSWVTAILSSGNAAVLLNGVPGKSFPFKRGVRQGIHFHPYYLSWLLKSCSILSMA